MTKTASGGWSPVLTTVSDDVTAKAAFVASGHQQLKHAGITIDTAKVAASGGFKRLKAGTVMAKVTATGKYGPYDDAASDGRQTAVGFLFEDADVTNGDVIAGLLMHGAVYESRVTGLDANGKTDLGARFTYV